MRRKQTTEQPEPEVAIEIPAIKQETGEPEVVKQPEPEPVKRNIFGQIIRPIVGGIGSGAAK